MLSLTFNIGRKRTDKPPDRKKPGPCELPGTWASVRRYEHTSAMLLNPFIMSGDVETGLRIAVGHVTGQEVQASMSTREASVRTPIALKVLGYGLVRHERVGSVDSGYSRSLTRLVPFIGSDHRKRGMDSTLPRNQGLCVILAHNEQEFNRWTLGNYAD